MNGVKAGITSSEGQLTGVLSMFLALHEKIGFELTEANLDAVVALGVAYIVGRTAVKCVAAWKGGTA